MTEAEATEETNLDNDNASDSYDEDDDEETSWTDELRTSWRQHCLAILIAIAATAFAYFYKKITVSPLILSIDSERRILSAPSTLEQVRHPHAHLVGFQRTANITFCGGRFAAEATSPLHSELETMDFHVPDSLIPIVLLYFQHDVLEYDTLDPDTAALVDINSHPEMRCLRRLQGVSPQAFVKGITYFYKTPAFASTYRESPEELLKPSATLARRSKDAPPRLQPAVLTFTGFAAKFVNMATTPVLLNWDGRGGDDRNRRLVGEIPPFDALSTATRPGESFSVSPVYDHSLALDRWTVTADDPVLYFEPLKQKKALTKDEEIRYQMQKMNQEFAKHYLIHSGRAWLSNFPRAFPMHHMYQAEYFGQTHEIHSGSETQPNFTLEVLSVTPRVFRIANFLSAWECDTLIQLAVQNGLHASTVYAGGGTPQRRRDVQTRSSSNAWLDRNHHLNLTDRIYRRAAQVLQMDEASFGHVAPVDDAVEDPRYHSIAESLQVIRYKTGEEYTPHHDWVVASPDNRYQPCRFATLLIYLNDDFEGGETIFPRAVNKHYQEGIKIQPQQGTAILFYNMLPDGNVDDLSQHGSEKVTHGEKVRRIGRRKW
jgi:prolyl 4-hydroxylase